MAESVADELAAVSLKCTRTEAELVCEDAEIECEKRWHLPLEDAYQLAVSTIRHHTSQGCPLSYSARVKLSALSQQVLHGPCQSAQRPALGALDFVGRERRQAWLSLGYQSRSDSMLQYIDIVDQVVPKFAASAVDQSSRHAANTLSRDHQQQGLCESQRLQQASAEDKADEELVRNQIKDALNKQTYDQFRDYARHQYPGNVEQQALLVRQLQEQHYQQYMRQLYQHQLAATALPTNGCAGGASGVGASETKAVAASSSTVSVCSADEGGDNDSGFVNGTSDALSKHSCCDTSSASVQSSSPVETGSCEHEAPANGGNSDAASSAEAADDCTDSAGAVVSAVLEPAQLWTRSDLTEFKSAIRKEGGDAVLTVGYGETVTVRVPTHDEGVSVYWEFATDHYDIGFGVMFEWGESEERQVTVQVSDSGDEQDDYDDLDPSDSENTAVNSDPERGSVAAEDAASSSRLNHTHVSCVIPVYRRDSHREVYAGSHRYPGDGVYLLKFDNSYSLWRSKTLYYRVYYSR